jgi:hypothetical protein
MEARRLSPALAPPVQLSLRIRHPSLDPAALSRELGIEPVHSFRAGDPRPRRNAHTGASLYGESYWLGMLRSPEWSLAAPFGERLIKVTEERLRSAATPSFGGVLWLAAVRFLRVHGKLLRRIRAEGGEVSLLLAVAPASAPGFTLAPEISRVLSELGVALELDFVND